MAIIGALVDYVVMDTKAFMAGLKRAQDSMPHKAKVHGQAEARQRRVQRAGMYDKARGSASSRGYGATWQPIREAALLRDMGACVKCGALVGKSGHVDHIVSKANGGSDELSNLQTLCARCHASKTATEDGGFGNA